MVHEEEVYDDEDDENDEANWRNDYPDESDADSDKEERYGGVYLCLSFFLQTYTIHTCLQKTCGTENCDLLVLLLSVMHSPHTLCLVIVSGLIVYFSTILKPRVPIPALFQSICTHNGRQYQPPILPISPN